MWAEEVVTVKTQGCNVLAGSERSDRSVSVSGAIRAVLFDIGDVLEIVGPPTFLDTWRDRLGLSPDAFDAATAGVDPDGRAGVGAVTEAQVRQRYAVALGLTAVQADELMADVWDWYCGRLDDELVAFVRTLRPRVRTGIVSNSSDGARREEQRRYGFEDLVDDIVYSHEVGIAKPDPAIFRLACDRLGVAPAEAVFVDDVPGHVAAAAELGMHGVLHRRTPETIAAVDALLRANA